MKDYTQSRLNMVNCHLRTNKLIHQGLIDAFSQVAREAFVPEESRNIAYVDEDLALGNGRFLMDPMVLARMLQALDPQAEQTALIVGGNAGYSAAVLANLISTVVVLDSDEGLVETMTRHFDEQAVNNAVAVQGDLKAGYEKQGPYDLIVFDGAVDDVPESYSAQLAENGRMIAVVMDQSTKGKQQLGRVCLFEKLSGTVNVKVLFDANIPLLPGFKKEESFTF
ncbi:protein-L-isoaspartate O-methyltransferase family protein [Kiloniella sp. b19]|uniref:protein-L-isoaspartate O-methyltransferase family protein n=1 Tax=Kiloniella sp. GXU_MW_B19 TaxID=3141326 RepID=UPI0031D0B60B